MDYRDKENYFSLHKRLWHRIIDIIKESDIVKLRGRLEDIKEKCVYDLGYKNVESNCFLCEYSKVAMTSFCDKCPIKSKFESICSNAYNPFMLLNEALNNLNKEEAIKQAELIRDCVDNII